MVAHSLSDFETLQNYQFLGAEAGAALKKPTQDFIAERADEILALVLDDPKAINSPYGYKTHTPAGKVKFKAEWQTTHPLFEGMTKLGFERHRKSIESGFSVGQTSRVNLPENRKLTRMPQLTGLGRTSSPNWPCSLLIS